MTKPKVFVYEYYLAGFHGSAVNKSHHEYTREFEVKSDDVIVPTVVVRYEMDFRESQSWSRRLIKIVVIDESREGFDKLVEALKAEMESVQITGDVLVELADEVFEKNEYSYSRLVHEVDGYHRERLTYLLQP